MKGGIRVQINPFRSGKIEPLLRNKGEKEREGKNLDVDFCSTYI